jgi:hypothetical protein
MAIKKKAARQTSKRTASPKKVPPARKKVTPIRKKFSPTRKAKKPQRPRTTGASTVSRKSLEALNERLDMMLPEVMFRIAALEHLLVKNQLCSYEELVNARQFIQDQERS